MIMCDSSRTLMPRKGNSELSMKGEAGAALINVSSCLPDGRMRGGNAGKPSCRPANASIIAGLRAKRVAVFQHGGILVSERPGLP
ncbi:hypothetical protein D3C78_1597540 [compost metagenome]